MFAGRGEVQQILQIKESGNGDYVWMQYLIHVFALFKNWDYSEILRKMKKGFYQKLQNLKNYLFVNLQKVLIFIVIN